MDDEGSIWWIERLGEMSEIIVGLLWWIGENEIENKKCHANFILIGYLMKAATVAAAIAKNV